jgi:hypothetical protein
MKKLFQILEDLKPRFIDELEEQLFLYTTIGSGTHQSPMWIQLNPMRTSSDMLMFQNSQTESILFMLDSPDEDKKILFQEYPDAYDYFKYVKYKHIIDHFPTVFQELAQGVNGVRISLFLNSYKTIA